MPPSDAQPLLPSARAASARRFVLLMGSVSCFGDATYEGARGLLGPWLAALGAQAAVVGAVAGASSLAAQAPRLLTGPLADSAGGRYRWPLVLGGYSANLWAVPALALVHSWQAAAALFLVERFGKSVRSPARSALVAPAAKSMGVGLGFALDQLLDSGGSVLGSVLTAAVLAAAAAKTADAQAPYRLAFAVLLAPAIINCGLAAYAAWRVPHPDVTFGADDGRSDGQAAHSAPASHRTPAYAAIAAGVMLAAAGAIEFALIAYAVTQGVDGGAANKHKAPPLTRVPLLYALAHAVAAAAALLGGLAFDRVGGGAVLAAVSAASAAVGPLVFLVPPSAPRAVRLGALVAAVMLHGAADGARTSSTKAAVAQALPSGHRGAAYGELAALQGAAKWVGSTALGVLYQHHSPAALVVLSVALQVAAIPCFLAAQM